MRKVIALALMATALPISTASAQTVTVEAEIHSKFIDEDLFVLTDEPTVVAGVYYDFNENCSLDAWGMHGATSREGSELDIGISCRSSIDNETEVEVYLYRDFLYGYPNIWELSSKVTHGNFDIAVTYFEWVYQDAVRVVAGYNVEATDSITIRPKVAFETGFDEPNIVAVGANVEYRLNDKVAIQGNLLSPVLGGGERTTQASVGMSFYF